MRPLRTRLTWTRAPDDVAPVGGYGSGFLLYCPFGCGEADLGMRSVAERLGRRAAAPAQRDRLTFGTVFIAVDVANRDRTFDEIWSVLAGCDDHGFCLLYTSDAADDL